MMIVDYIEDDNQIFNVYEKFLMISDNTNCKDCKEAKTIFNDQAICKKHYLELLQDNKVNLQ